MPQFLRYNKPMLIAADLLSLFSLAPVSDLPPPVPNTAWDPSSIQFLASIHGAKSEALKTIIAEYGWPTDEEFGEHAHAAAFMIVVHADYDVEFQTNCHQLLLESATRGDIPLGFLAFLTDRILCNLNLHQRFGTQIREAANGCFVPKAIEDTEKVDALRAQAGLSENLSEYYARVNGGDLLLPRPLLGGYDNMAPETSGDNVIEFPGKG